MNLERGIRELFTELCGKQSEVVVGSTDEGDKWYSNGPYHLALSSFDNNVALFKDWKLVAIAPSLVLMLTVVLSNLE